VLLGGLAGSAVGTEVYKSIDPDGHVSYSDHAESRTAEKSVVHLDAPDPLERARLAHERELLAVEDRQRKQQQLVEAQHKAEQEQLNQTRCENARNRYYLLHDARRVYTRDADGNRVYLPDAVADAKREEARQAMLSACEP
jgi:hypothetical protein